MKHRKDRDGERDCQRYRDKELKKSTNVDVIVDWGHIHSR